MREPISHMWPEFGICQIRSLSVEYANTSFCLLSETDDDHGEEL